jgi:Fungal rhodopsin domain
LSVHKGQYFAWWLYSNAGICFPFVYSTSTDHQRSPYNYWTLTFEPQPECISETKHLLAAGIVNTLTDFMVVVIPIPILSRLQLPTQQVIIVVMLFAAGFLVTISGAVRSVYIYKATTSWDRTWQVFPAWVTSLVELDVGLVSRDWGLSYAHL